MPLSTEGQMLGQELLKLRNSPHYKNHMFKAIEEKRNRLSPEMTAKIGQELADFHERYRHVNIKFEDEAVRCRKADEDAEEQAHREWRRSQDEKHRQEAEAQRRQWEDQRIQMKEQYRRDREFWKAQQQAQQEARSKEQKQAQTQTKKMNLPCLACNGRGKKPKEKWVETYERADKTSVQGHNRYLKYKCGSCNGSGRELRLPLPQERLDRLG
ncbi:hypothetical protein FKW77_009694 [Venturia effusa]|uniref:Uncharacterized protein n=1 Tax=Venturia effusa TaxID=50376 RepID=A0A517L226_9PEZI|nr:hypothetical protein FKW77_009694 [Venturia effusa]